MLETFHEHTLDILLLKPGCTVLDVGCRGFEFGNALRERFQADVYDVDIDDLNTPQFYYRCGIDAMNGSGAVSQDDNPEARCLVAGNQIKVYTIEYFQHKVGVNHWDAIKLDCEGSEYGILWHLKEPPATQISVEFHQHTEERRSEAFMAELIDRLRQWYDVRQHQLYGKASYLNYWDSLFTLK